LFNPSLEHLQMPIFDFLKEIRQETLEVCGGGTLIHVQSSAPLGLY